MIETIKRDSIIRRCRYDWPPELKPTHGVNAYVGCAHNCSYCWARDLTYRFRKRWGIPDGFQWDKPLLIQKMLDVFRADLNRLKPGRALLSNMTDPYQPLEETHFGTRAMLLGLGAYGWETVVLTKANGLPYRDFDLMQDFGTWFGVTVTEERDLARRELLERASRRGISTFISLEPWIPGVNPYKIYGYMLPYPDYWIIGSLNKSGRAVDPEFYQKELPRLRGYLRDKGARFYIKKELRRVLERGSHG